MPKTGQPFPAYSGRWPPARRWEGEAFPVADLCNSANVPEVEIISLLEEQLPLYQLRADKVFGYDHDDWIQTPLVPSDVAGHLTPQQTKETLEYFWQSLDLIGVKRKLL
ncbi:hypothetical protein JRQ81_005150 [Phrynocephalus forsythii]|uniref:HAP1 N-terminal domain-containing protein n=1 Tax=Phrynocephalus forsythii TaxID=171643 RepID=A0A9Q0XGB9_9SAUR|nr:hypothetical protein JRQ81_005150 [Phrynocephalus forsythii]